MTAFKDSHEAAFRRVIREAVRKSSDFTKSERDVTLAIVNQWFHHKAKGKIFPGRAKLAKRAKVTEKTVSRTLAKLRSAGVLIPLTTLKGNRYRATEYRVDLVALLTFCGCDWVDIFRSNVPSRMSEMSRLQRDKMSHRIYNVQPLPSQKGEC